MCFYIFGFDATTICCAGENIGTMALETTTIPSFQPKSAKKLVLMVEPDPNFAKIIRPLIESNGFLVTIVAPDDLLGQAKARQPYLILLNLGRDDSGLKLCAELKASPYTSAIPVAVLSRGLADETAELQAFAQGADDYIVQPASEELLRARIRGALRRYSPPADLPEESLQLEGMKLDLRSRKVFVNNVPVALTRKEFDLLVTFLRRRGQVVYTTHLYHTVWGYGESAPVDSHTVKVHVSSLRTKLGPEIGKRIVNLPGIGYRIDN